MPHFYFHLRTPMGWERDDTGSDFLGLEAAYLDACRTIPEMAADLVRKKRNPLPYVFEITDEAGQLLMEVPFAEVLDRGGKLPRPGTPVLVQTEMARTVRLIASLAEEREALQASLREMRELVARAHQVSARGPWQCQA